MKRLLICIFLTGLHFGVFSQTVFLDEDFNDGIPATFQIQNGGSTDLTWEAVPNYMEGNTPRSLNGSQFLFCNGDPAGAGSSMNEYITSPAFNTSQATSLVLQFSQFYRDYNATATDTGIIEVFDGNDWVVVGFNVVNKGTWQNPQSARINITAYKNFEMRVRFRFVGEWPWYWAIDNLKVFTPSPKDVGVQSVVAPLTDCNLGDNVVLKLKVANYGTQSQPGIPVKYSVNGGTPLSQTMSASIGPNATRDITFTTPISTTALGEFKLTMWTDHDGDQDRSNDTLKGFSFTRYLNSYPTVPFTGYEGTNLSEVYAGWREGRGSLPNGLVSSWTRSSTAQEAFWGPQSKTTAKINLSSNVLKEWMVGPAFTPLATTGFEFKAAITDWQETGLDYMGSDDSLKIMVSANCGLTWKVLFAINANTGLTNSLTRFVVPLAQFAGQEIKIAIYATEGNINNEEDYDLHVDDINIVSLPSVDLGVSSIKSPVSNCGLGASSVTVQIRNFGSKTQRNFPVKYNFNNGAAVTETFTDSIRPNQVKEYTFNQLAAISPVGIYTFNAWTAVQSDANASNDSTKKYQVENSLAINTFPYIEKFEDGPAGWKVGGVLPSWALGTPQKTIINSPGEGSNSWTTGGLGTGTYNTNERSFVVSPCYNFSGLINPVFEAKIWWHTEYERDGALLQYSINGGTNWRNVGLLNDPNNWYNTETIPALSFIPQVVPQTGWSGGVGTNNSGSNGWVTVRNFVKLAAGEPVVKFRIVFASSPTIHGDGFAFDQVSIYEGPTKDVELLEITNPTLSNCQFGPNFPIKVKLINKGSQTISDIPISYKINNLPTVTEIIAASIDSNQTFEYSFAQPFDFSTPGLYNIKVWSSFVGDDIKNNDSILVHQVAVYNNGLDTLKFDNYNGSNLSRIFPGYREAKKKLPIGTVSNWTKSNAIQTNFYGGSPTARLNLFSNINQEWLITPQIQCEATTRLMFRMAITKANDVTFGRLGIDDSVMVRISSDCGSNWSTLRYFNRDSVFTQNFRTFRINLSAYAGQKIIIAFYGSDGKFDNPEDVDVHINKVLILPSPANDLAMAGLVSPISPCGLGSAELIKVKVLNNGAANQSNYTIGYSVNNGVPVLQTVSSTLVTGQENELTFTQPYNFTLPNTYTIKVWVSLTGDAVPVNDVSQFVIRKFGLPTTVLNFNGYGGQNIGEVAPEWKEATGTVPAIGNSAWDAFSIGSNTVAKVKLAGDSKKEWLISPVLKLGNSSKLRFKAARRIPNTNLDIGFYNDDKVHIKATSDCGQSWTTIKIYTDTNQTALSASFSLQEIDLSAFDNQEVNLAFFAEDGVRADSIVDFLLDDISVYSVASITDVGVVQFLNFGPEIALGVPNPIQIRLKNYGNIPIPGLSLIKVKVGTNSFAAYVPNPVAPGTSADISLGEYTPFEEGTITACAFLKLLPGGDFESANDTICQQIVIIGADPILEAPSFTAFPNPVHDMLIVRSEQPAEMFHKMHLVNMFGQRISIDALILENNELKFDLSLVPKGVYYLMPEKVSGSNLRSNTEKVKIIKL
jgi:hypothetical protein